MHNTCFLMTIHANIWDGTNIKYDITCNTWSFRFFLQCAFSVWKKFLLFWAFGCPSVCLFDTFVSIETRLYQCQLFKTYSFGPIAVDQRGKGENKINSNVLKKIVFVSNEMRLRSGTNEASNLYSILQSCCLLQQFYTLFVVYIYSAVRL